MCTTGRLTRAMASPQQQYVHAPQRLEPEDVQVDRIYGLYKEFGEPR